MFTHGSHDNVDGMFTISLVASFTDTFIVADFNVKLMASFHVTTVVALLLITIAAIRAEKGTFKPLADPRVKTPRPLQTYTGSRLQPVKRCEKKKARCVIFVKLPELYLTL